MILPNSACDTLAVANEGEGAYDSSLTDPEGSVSLITNLASATPTITTVSLNQWTDSELLAAGVHLPLSLNALKCVHHLQQQQQQQLEQH